MADFIKVTPEQLKATASSMESVGNSIKNTTSSMLSEVSGISQNIWSGEASGTFIKKFQGMQTDINKMCKRLNEQSKHLAAIAAEYSKSEEANKTAAASLKNQLG
jgi:WXG100 family type VII secretion target